MRVKVAGLSRDHVKGAGIRQRQRAGRDGCGESGAGSANLMAAGLRTADSDVRHLLVRLDEPVGVCTARCAQPGPLRNNRCGMVGEARVGSQISPRSEVGAHWCLQGQKRRHRPVEGTRCGQGHTGCTAGGHQATSSSFQCQFGSGTRHGPAPEFPRCATYEDILTAGVQHPVVAFARVIIVARHFNETLVQTQVVPDWVLPSLSVLSVVWKVVHDELIDAVECEPSLRALADRHHNERVVTERRLFRFNTFLCSPAFLGISFISFSFSTRTHGFSLHLSALLWSLALLLLVKLFLVAGFRWTRRAQFHGRRGRLLLTHQPLSSPQQAADAEWGLLQESLGTFHIIHLRGQSRSLYTPRSSKLFSVQSRAAHWTHSKDALIQSGEEPKTRAGETAWQQMRMITATEGSLLGLQKVVDY